MNLIIKSLRNNAVIRNIGIKGIRKAIKSENKSETKKFPKRYPKPNAKIVVRIAF